MGTFGKHVTQEQIEKLLANAAAPPTIRECKPLYAAGPDDDEAKTEKEFQAAVVKEAKKYGWECYHTHDSRKSARGYPDLAIGRLGLVLIAELKVGKNEPTADQVRWLNYFRSAGTPTYLWYPKDWAEIEGVLRTTSGPCPFAKQWTIQVGEG